MLVGWVVVVVGGLLVQHQQPFTHPPHVWVIPRCGDMPRQVTHGSRATALGGAARPSDILNWQRELRTTSQGALDSQFGGK